MTFYLWVNNGLNTILPKT